MKTPHEHGNGTAKKRAKAPKATLAMKSAAKLARRIADSLERADKNKKAFKMVPPAPEPRVQLPADQPRHYGDGSRYDTDAHYAVGDPTLPVSDGAKARTDLNGKSDVQVVDYTYMHISKMTGNPNFTDEQPPAADFKGLADNYANSVTAVTAAKATLTQALSDRDVARAALDNAGWGVRVPYIQIASNGNTAVILSSGLSVRATPTPTPALQPPQNLRIDLNANQGQFVVTWNVVASSRSFILQRSVIDPAAPDARNWETVSTSPKRIVTLSDQTVGQTYAFRVATVGGSTGQSVWSPEVIRMSA